MPSTTAQAAVPSFSTTRELRRRGRTSIEQGATTDNYRGDREAVLRLLNEALATKLVCVLRYRRHHFMARGLASRRIAEEFLVHSDEELAHADSLADRIVQLGGEPDLRPGTLGERSRSEYVPGNCIAEMIKEDLAAERTAIDSYRVLVAYVGENDPTTRRMLEGILGVEEAHADELLDLLQDNKSL